MSRKRRNPQGAKARARYRAAGPMLVDARLVAQPSEEGTRLLRRIARRQPLAYGTVADQDALEAQARRWAAAVVERDVAALEELVVTGIVVPRGISMQLVTLEHFAAGTRDVRGLPEPAPAPAGHLHVVGWRDDGGAQVEIYELALEESAA